MAKRFPVPNDLADILRESQELHEACRLYNRLLAGKKAFHDKSDSFTISDLADAVRRLEHRLNPYSWLFDEKRESFCLLVDWPARLSGALSMIRNALDLVLTSMRWNLMRAGKRLRYEFNPGEVDPRIEDSEEDFTIYVDTNEFKWPPIPDDVFNRLEESLKIIEPLRPPEKSSSDLVSKKDLDSVFRPFGYTFKTLQNKAKKSVQINDDEPLQIKAKRSELPDPDKKGAKGKHFWEYETIIKYYRKYWPEVDFPKSYEEFLEFHVKK